MQRIGIVIIVLLMSVRIFAQPQSCTDAAIEASEILTNAQTLLGQGNVEGATTLIGISRDKLDTCVATVPLEPTQATASSTSPPTQTPAPTTEAVATQASIIVEKDYSELYQGGFTVNPPTVDEDQGIAFLHFAHTSVDVGAIDLYMDNAQEPIVSNLNYGEATPLIWVRSGGHTFTARPAGTGINGDQLYRTNWNYPSNSTWIVVAAGVQEEFAFIVEPISIIRNNYNDQARVRIVNFIANAPRLFVEDTSRRVFANGLRWIGIQDMLVTEGNYAFNVSSLDRDIVTAIPSDLSFEANTTTTLLTMGRGTAEEPVTFLRLVARQEETRVRFINNSAAPIEIYMRPDNQLLVELLDPGAETDYYTLPSGAATFISYAPGTGPTGRQLAGLPWQLRPGRDMTIQVNAENMNVQEISLRQD